MRPLVVEPNMRSRVVQLLGERHPSIPVVTPATPAAVPEALDRAHDEGPVAFLCRNSQWRDTYLDGLREGDWVFTKTTGYEQYPVEAFGERGIVFSNCPGLTAAPIAEHVFALLLSVSRRLDTYRVQQAERTWAQRRAGMTDFAGDVCCVLGVGRIGERVAERAGAFDMHVRGVKRDIESYDGAADEVYGPDDIPAALDGARVLVLAVPLTEATRSLVGRPELRRLDDSAVVVNVCRGPVLDTDALVEALEADEVRAACLDVVDERPPPPEWPLWEREDVLVTPHVAGSSDKTPARLVERLASQYEQWTDGEPLANRVV